MHTNDSAGNTESKSSLPAALITPAPLPRATADLPITSPALSKRQLKVASYVALGYSNRDIAGELGLTQQIVKNVVHSLFDLLGVWNRVELANYFSEGSSADRVEAARKRIERDRLAEVRRMKILDTAAERIFDELASLAARIFEVPIALVAFADSERIWFKSCIGLSAAYAPREITLCQHTIQQSKVFVVTDASIDERFMCNPLVTADPKLKFYAAAPILSGDGYALGVVCIVDRVPRQFDQSQLSILQSLARVAVEQLEVRRQLLEEKAVE
ncbi:MAG: GAF domain-containing protein [Terriglobales bacterium]